MILAGPCSYINKNQERQIFKTADALNKIKFDLKIDLWFRCKLYLGGTSPEKFKIGIEEKGIRTLRVIQKYLPTGTEIQTISQLIDCFDFDYIWLGARNAQNYGLLKEICEVWPKGKPIFIKRNPGMTIKEIIGLYDIIDKIYKKEVYIIDRGILTFDRQSDSRWSPDLKGIIQIKNERPDIFNKLMMDCSHSVGRKEYIKDTYNAFKAIGCKNFMFECTENGKSLTDQIQMLSTEELKNILKG
jgi:3-deoxy-D-arabino-heptulosonate 7-phosphate (DAHP) synthase